MTDETTVREAGDCEQVTISQKEYDSLKDDRRMLIALETAGVDNWDGYFYAMEPIEDYTCRIECPRPDCPDCKAWRAKVTKAWADEDRALPDCPIPAAGEGDGTATLQQRESWHFIDCPHGTIARDCTICLRGWIAEYWKPKVAAMRPVVEAACEQIGAMSHNLRTAVDAYREAIR